MHRLGIVLVLLLLACGGSSPSPIKKASTEEKFTVDGQASVVLVPTHPADGRPLVVYHHGHGENAESLVTDKLKTGVIAALVEAGFFVASTDAHGDNWGSDQAVDDYVALVKETAGRFHTGPVMFLSQSMGGISGLRTIADGRVHVTAWAGIYPIVNLDAAKSNPKFAKEISAVFGDDTAAVNPVMLPSSAFAGVPMIVWASPDDRVAVKSTNGDLLARLVPVEIELAHGDHGDASHFNPPKLVEFFNAHR